MTGGSWVQQEESSGQLVTVHLLKSYKSQDLYIQAVTATAARNIQKCLEDNVKYIEVAFPEFRKADVSVSETLAINRQVSVNIAKTIKQDLLIVLPEAKELKYAKDVPFKVSSIERLNKAVLDKEAVAMPKVHIVVNPGFNVDEWISLAKSYTALQQANISPTVIIVNGNLQRLKSGYYPRLFYPYLNAVAQSFYTKFNPAFTLANVAVNGDAFGCYIAKQYTNANYDLIVKTSAGVYEVSKTYPPTTVPPATDLWKEATALYSQARR
eukprot:gene27974-33780_t